MENSFRIHTEITKDAVLNVNMRQDFDFLEVLSLKLRQADAYKLHSSNYGVMVGRVLANDAFGIPNARVSVFVANEGGETSEIEKLYPYSSIRSTDSEGRRYNLLPDYSDDECYRVVGTFPNKRLVLDNNTVLEVFDKYWKYSTVTNNAGDYMIFGIPSGNQEIKVDLDLSDIGILSQKPTDFTYKGYNLSMFDSPTQFKESTNLEGLPQLFSQNKSVFVYPFWGDAENGIAAITRSDVQIQYKFEPTCVFMGSIVSDNDSNAINHKCAPDINNGMNDQLVTGEGNIEMIRKTPDGLVEEFQVQTGEALIDSNGVWCYQIPMNLDYVGMDEYGNIVPTDNPSKGVPTRAQVRFRISKNETGDEGFSRHTAKYLVPMNPVFDSGKVVPTIKEPGREIEKMYNFGSNTPQSCFRDLYWNNVYSVKNYIPKFQVAHRVTSKNYSALKGANLANDQNQLPFNKLRFDLPFVYMVLCIVYSMVIVIVGIVNTIICGVDAIIKVIRDIIGVKIPIINKRPFGFLLKFMPDYIGCIPLSAGLSDDNTAYYPGCKCDKTGLKKGACPKDLDNCKKSKNGSELKDKIQQSLAEEFKIVKLDLYQDWVNGVLYMPLWYWRKRKKQSFLFGLIKRKAKNQYCDCDKVFNRLKTFLTCSIEYNNNSLGTDDRNTDEGETRWHKKNKSHSVFFKHGLIKQVENKDGLNIYYYSALDATSDNDNAKLLMIDRPSGFTAVRLYATDIILLGNLNEDNLYGIPQLFKALPSTTANIPPIATISEPSETENEDEERNSTNVDNDAAYSEDSGVTLTTGMDWGNKDAANRQSPRFSHGLFMDLACTYTRTKAKSCINVERLSELGVNYDTNYEMPFRGGGDIDSGELPADGFISKYELDDLENRAMFATMNYIGFTPQPYQTEKSLYTTQVYDKNTGYLVPKFRYLYPVDFDGRMAPIMRRYKHGFNYSQSDVPDETYMTFRLGADKNNSDDKGVRHFYIQKGGKFAMPLYDNSYYFYFGLNKGNTAIEKFNQKFFAECFQNNKDWFTLDIDTQGQSYCTGAYKPNLKLFDDNDKAHGYINVKSDDIQIPYEYTVTYLDNGGEIISAETNVSRNTFKVYVDENGTYEVKVTDGNGKTIRKNVVLSKPKITIEYDVVALGTKFYNSEATERPYICDKESGLYGTITFTGLTVDGYDGTIINISDPMPYNSENDLYEFNVTATTEVHQLVTAHVKMRVAQSFEEGKTTKDCCCKYKPEPTDYNELDHFINYTTSLQFNIYIPSMFLIEVEQTGPCEHENISSSIANVENSMNFNTFLNDMPVRFMLGTVQDKVDTSKEKLIIAQQSNFYHNDNENSTPMSSWLSGWYGVHDESKYRFNLDSNKVTEENEEVWSDFVDFTIFSTTYTKLKIDKFKLDSMFSVADSTYVTEASNSNYVYGSQGGKRPVLTRLVAPYYQDTDKLTVNKFYLYEDNDTSTVDSNFPNIVGKNYSGTTENIEFNPIYRDNKGVIGNYFAAFTNNGGYSSTTGIDESKPVMAIPNHAAVNAKGGIVKQIGKDLEGVVTDFEKAYKYNNTKPIMPHFRAMYVDRRFDYNLMVFAPIVGQSIKIGDDEITWRSGRISGATFNGIEMAYDENYNVVSANTVLDDEGVILSVTRNRTLEYSYEIPNESADTRTVFNYESDVLKKPYSASINGFDIRDKFWSQKNNRINTGWEGIPCYPPVNTESCNDWFNIDNYPTRRIIDIGNIPYMPSYEFNYTSCAYKGNSSINEKNELAYIIDEGESTDIPIDFVNGIEFVPANADNKFYSNVQYSYNGNKFTAGSINMRFKYRPFNSSDDTHDVYTSTPVIIGVKKETSGNTITKIKRLSNRPRRGNNSIEEYIKDEVKCIVYGKKDSERPSGIEFNDGAPERVRELEGGSSPIFSYFKSGDDYITSNDTEFSNIIFDKHKSFNSNDINGAKVFTIMYKRSYVDNTGSYLNRYLTTYEFGDMYDARDIALRPVNGSCGSDGCTGSYVIRSTSAVNTSGSVSGSGGQSTSVTTQGDTSAYTQVLEFEIDTRGTNNCQIFNQGNSIGYSMTVSPIQMSGIWGALGQNVARTVDNSEVEVKFSETGDFAVEYVKVRFTWPQDMGYLGDSTWPQAYCSIFAKTSSGFVYRIGDFKLTGRTNVSGDKSPTTGLTISSI